LHTAFLQRPHPLHDQRNGGLLTAMWHITCHPEPSPENQSVLPRLLSNGILAAGLTLGLLLQLVVFHVPVAQPLMQTVPLHPYQNGGW